MNVFYICAACEDGDVAIRCAREDFETAVEAARRLLQHTGTPFWVQWEYT